MIIQEGTNGVVLGVRDQVASLLFSFHFDEHPFAFLDIILVAVILYYAYVLIRETRAMRILYGIIILAAIYVIAQWLQLVTLLLLLRTIFAAILVAVPVVFQPELRAALERIGRTRFMHIHGIDETERTNVVRILVQAITVLASKKTGALIVIEQGDRLKEIASTGIRLHANISSELLLSIFMNHSPLHDGAVIIRGSKIEVASALLPVTKDKYDASVGTRHRAAIGVSEETDSVAIVVSEESGRIAVAKEGKLTRNISANSLEVALLRMLRESEVSAFESFTRRFSKKSQNAA